MMSSTVTIALATSADAKAIAQIESDPEYEGQVGHWSAERHLEEMALASSRYLIIRNADGEIAGFALLQGIGDDGLKVHLKRIAVRQAGKGVGSLFLRELLDWVFTKSDTNRVDLDVFEGNDRAKRAYEKAGFKTEGLLRDYHRQGDGSFASMWLMSILRREWQSLTGTGL